VKLVADCNVTEKFRQQIEQNCFMHFGNSLKGSENLLLSTALRFLSVAERYFEPIEENLQSVIDLN